MKEFLALVFEVFLLVFVAEMGDKTQFAIMAMTSKFKVLHIILGVGASIIALNVFAVLVGSFIGNIIPTEYISIIAGLAFFYFAYTTIADEDEENMSASSKNKLGPVIAVFGTFTLAELGDKTQLAALTKAAEEGFGGAFSVLLGASIGLLAADMIGLFVGYVLGSKLPSNVFAILSYLIFAIFGILKIYGGLEKILIDRPILSIAVTSAISIIFAALSLARLLKLLKEKKADKTNESK